MKSLSRNMQKHWKKNESILLSSNIFTRRLLIITDEYLDAIDYQNMKNETSLSTFTSDQSTNDGAIPYSGCKFSYYRLEIIAINLMRHYDRFIARLVNIMKEDTKFEHQYRYIYIQRLVAFRLSAKNEKIILSYLQNKANISQVDLFENYETKDKIDFILNDTTCPYFRKPVLTEGEKVYMDNPESREKASYSGDYFTTLTMDFRLDEEEKIRIKDLNKIEAGHIR